MKKKLAIIIPFALVFSGVVFWSCNKEDLNDRTLEFPSLQPANLDIDAGTWTPVLLASPDEFALGAPVATNAPAYVAELNEIKAYQRDLSDEQKASIKYWSAGAVLRWNEILRELVARHNLPPYQNEDGTYPAPSAQK